MSLQETVKSDEETQLNINTAEPLEMDDSYQKPIAIKWGNCYPFMMRNNIPKIVLGPHWPLFLCAYMLFFCASVLLITWHFTSTKSDLVKWATLIVCVNQCLSYAWVALVNPGVANQDNFGSDKPKLTQQNELQNEGKAWYCNKCCLIQKIGTMHCSDCEVCIEEMDHHCPWTGKCIGKGNLKQFYYFLASTLIFMIFNIIASLTQLDSAFTNRRMRKPDE